MPPINGESSWTFRGIEYLNHILILELIHRSDIELPFNHILFHYPSLKRNEHDSQPRFVKNPLKNSINDKDIELANIEQGAKAATNKNIIEPPPIMLTSKEKLTFTKGILKEGKLIQEL